MKSTKKIIVSVLALSMLFSMPVYAHGKSHHHHHNHKACNIVVTDDASTDSSVIEDAAAEASSVDEAVAETSTEVAATEASTDVAATNSSVDATVDSNFSIGELKDNVYENEFFNVRIDAPKDFVFNENGLITRADNNSAGDDKTQLALDIVDKALATDHPIQLLNANNGRSSLDINIGYVADNTDDYLNEAALIESKLDDIVEPFESMGLTDVKSSVGTTTFLGEEHPCMDITGTIEGISYNHRYVCIPKDGYVLFIGFGGIDQKDFSLIEKVTNLN